jgi:hypothetical protein
MRTIPQIRERLHELADLLGVPELHDLANETKRRSPPRRVRNESVPVTPALERAVRNVAKAKPHWSYRRIGEYFGINIGRISEILTGFREDAP